MVTNGLNAAITVREGAGRVIVLGGLLTPELSTVNPGTACEPPQVHLDLLILGCGGLSIDRGITFRPRVEVRRMLVGLADRVVVAADHSKFDHKKAMVLGPLDLIDVLVTDHTPPEPPAPPSPRPAWKSSLPPEHQGLPLARAGHTKLTAKAAATEAIEA